jgi:hypothetical protein
VVPRISHDVLSSHRPGTARTRYIRGYLSGVAHVDRLMVRVVGTGNRGK